MHRDKFNFVSDDFFVDEKWIETIQGILENSYHPPIKTNIDIGKGWLLVADSDIGKRKELSALIFVKIGKAKFYAVGLVLCEGADNVNFVGLSSADGESIGNTFNGKKKQCAAFCEIDIDLTNLKYAKGSRSITRFLKDFEQAPNFQNKIELEQWI